MDVKVFIKIDVNEFFLKHNLLINRKVIERYRKEIGSKAEHQ